MRKPTTKPAASKDVEPQPNRLTDLVNWISMAECAARLPSVHAGKRTQSVTVLRMARKHGLEILRRGSFRFIYWPDVLELFQPEQEKTFKAPRQPRFPNMARRSLAQAEWTRKKLEEMGVA